MSANIIKLTAHAVDDQAESDESQLERNRKLTERQRRVEARRSARSFRQAAAKTNSPSDRIAFSHDAWLITHPEACSTEADYPEWAAQFAAAREADNRRAKEATR